MKMKKVLKNKVVNAATWYMVSEFFIRGLAFLTLPIFTRLLSPEEFGIVSVYSSVVSIFTILIGLSFPMSVARAKTEFNEKYNEFVSSLVFLNILFFILFSLIVLLFQGPLANLIGLEKEILILVLFHAFFIGIKKLFTTKLRYEYKYKIVSLFNIFIGILGVIVSLWLIYYVFPTNSDLGRIYGMSSVIIISGAFILGYMIFKGKEFINADYWKYALTLSLPLVLHDLSGVINSSADRILIGYYLGNDAAGIYSFSYNIGLIVSVLLIAANQAINPWFFNKMEIRDYEKIKSISVLYKNVFTLLYGVLLFVSPEVVKVMAPKEYWDGISIIPWIFFAYYLQFLITFETRIEHFVKRTGLLSLGTIFTAILNIILNIIFIPKFGYIAAALTTVISFSLMFFFHVLITHKIIKINLHGFKFYATALIFTLIITVSYDFLIDLIVLRYSIILGFGLLIISILFNSKILKNLK